MKVTFYYLSGIATPILRAVEKRGNFPTAYAASRNLKKIDEALEAPRKRMAEGDVRFYLDKRKMIDGEMRAQDEVQNNTEELARFSAGEKAFIEILNLEIDFSGYKFNLEKTCFVREEELEPEVFIPGDPPTLITQALARVIISLGLGEE